jgi:hypothetical protein
VIRACVTKAYIIKVFVTRACIIKPYANTVCVTKPISLRPRSTSLRPMSLTLCNYGVICHWDL